MLMYTSSITILFMISILKGCQVLSKFSSKVLLFLCFDLHYMMSCICLCMSNYPCIAKIDWRLNLGQGNSLSMHMVFLKKYTKLTYSYITSPILFPSSMLSMSLLTLSQIDSLFSFNSYWWCVCMAGGERVLQSYINPAFSP